MGWDGCRDWRNASDVRAAIVRDYAREPGWKIVASHMARGGEFWTVIENEGERHIQLFLIEKQSGQWMYKAMSERCGPFYYRCPLAYLDMATESNPRWRAAVRDRPTTATQPIAARNADAATATRTLVALTQDGED